MTRALPGSLGTVSAALALTLVTCLPLPSMAQVVRCTDPATGKVTYTDGDCGRGQSAREVEARKTPQEIQQEREQAAEALERKQERQQWERQQQRDDEPATRAARPRATPADPSQSVDCQRARRNLQEVLSTMGRGMYDEQARLDAAQRQADLACLSPVDYARAESARSSRTVYPSPYYAPPVVVVPPRPAPPPRREITHCNVFRCYDKQGNTYPR